MNNYQDFKCGYELKIRENIEKTIMGLRFMLGFDFLTSDKKEILKNALKLLKDEQLDLEDHINKLNKEDIWKTN